MLTLIVTRPTETGTAEVRAVYRNGIWECPDAAFLEVLQQIPAPLGYHPDPDSALVELVAARYCGRVEDARTKNPSHADAVY